MNEILNLSTICRCCHSDGHFKSLREQYAYQNQVEVYSVLLQNTFGIHIKENPVTEASYTICDECIVRVRDASRFKKQVELCEQKFLEYCHNEESMSASVKIENESDSDDFCDSRPSSPEYKETESIKVEGYPTDDTKATPKKEDSSEEVKPIKLNVEKKTAKKQASKPNSKSDGSNDLKEKTKKNVTRKRCNKTLIKRGPVICNHCGQRFKSRVILDRHLNNAHDIRSYICTFCTKEFISRQCFKDHLNTHSKEKIYICDICSKEFLYKSTLKHHIDEHFGRRKKCICDQCGLKFNDNTNLRIHYEGVHLNLRKFPCDYCPKTFKLKKHLRDHVICFHNLDFQSEVKQNLKDYQCDICDKKLSNSHALKGHKKRHDPNYKLKCKMCDAEFINRSTYRRHLHRHLGQLPFKCTHCPRDFLSRHTQMKHIESHSGINHVCDICSKNYSTKETLLRHKKLIHDSTKLKNSAKNKTKCEICKRYFADIDQHILQHRIRPLVCEVCSKTFNKKSAFNRHIRAVHGEVPMIDCKFCSRQYKRNHSLKRHMESMHSEMKTKVEIENDIDNIESSVPAFTPL